MVSLHVMFMLVLGRGLLNICITSLKGPHRYRKRCVCKHGGFLAGNDTCVCVRYTECCSYFVQQHLVLTH